MALASREIPGSQTTYQPLRVRGGKAVWCGFFRTQEEALAAVEEAR